MGMRGGVKGGWGGMRGDGGDGGGFGEATAPPLCNLTQMTLM